MTEAGLSVRTEGAILIATIDRPERGNALDGPTTAALIDVFEQVARERGSTRAIVLTGAGRHFCTGADLGGGGPGGERPSIGHMVRTLAAGPHRLIDLVWHCPVPTLALVHGRAAGYGLHLALTCDLAIAADDASFWEPFSQRGFNVDSGGSWLLSRRVGLARAKQLLYFAEELDADTAHTWGLVADVVPAAELESRGLALAARLAAGPTFALSETKRLLHDHLTTDLGAALEAEARSIELTTRSQDFREGMRAFAEKRDPTFTGE